MSLKTTFANGVLAIFHQLLYNNREVISINGLEYQALSNGKFLQLYLQRLLKPNLYNDH